MELLSGIASRVGAALIRGLTRAWLMVVPLVAALSLVRVAQLVQFWPQGYSASTSDLARTLLQGARFDLKVSATAVLLLLPALLWASGSRLVRVFAFLAFAYLLLSVINLHYFGFYKTPIDSLIFGLAEDDTTAVLTTVWSDFPVIMSLLSVVLMAFCAAFLYSMLQRRADPAKLLHSWHWTFRVLLLGVLTASLLLAAKGTLRHMALQRQHLTVTGSPFLNDMVPNGVIALKYAWDSRHQSQDLSDPLAGLRALGFESASAAASVLGLPAHSEEALLHALRTRDPLPADSRRKNLIFFLMESWGAEPMLYQSPAFDVLGRLAPTLESACHFRNFDSAQAGTHPSLEALLFSTPITPLTLGRAGRTPIPWSVAKVAREAGYKTLFVTSARAGWRNLDRVLKVQGFDELVDASTLQATYPEAEPGIWGVWDHYAFRYLESRLASERGDQPLFAFVLTSTNHPPYQLPPEYERSPLDLAQWRGESSSDTLLSNLHTYRYATDLLGGFVQHVLNGPRAEDFLIAAAGDHNVRSFGVYADARRRHLIRQVPFIIWGKRLQCGNQLDLPASHRDIFPTLFPLAGIEGPYINSGRNLMRPTAARHDPLNAPRALFFPGEARNERGTWTLGNRSSFMCSPASSEVTIDEFEDHGSAKCAFDPTDDLEERARLGLLDWNVRVALRR